MRFPVNCIYVTYYVIGSGILKSACFLGCSGQRCNGLSVAVDARSQMHGDPSLPKSLNATIWLGNEISEDHGMPHGVGEKFASTNVVRDIIAPGCDEMKKKA